MPKSIGSPHVDILVELTNMVKKGEALVTSHSVGSSGGDVNWQVELTQMPNWTTPHVNQSEVDLMEKLLDMAVKGDLIVANVDKQHRFAPDEIRWGLDMIEAGGIAHLQPPPIVSGSGYARAPVHQSMKQAAAALKSMQNALIQGGFDIDTHTHTIEDIGVAIEPIVGFRDFVWDHNFEGEGLYSRNGVFWPHYAPLIATCEKRGGLNLNPIAPRGVDLNQHDAPNENCQCGIYAFNRPTHPDLSDSATIWGEINMWGDVLICPDGWRSEYAYPKVLFVKDTGTKFIRRMVTKIEEFYGVPVLLVKERTGQQWGDVLDQARAMWENPIDIAEGGES